MKRKLEETSAYDLCADDECNQLVDTMVALKLMHAQFPKDCNVLPFVLRSQLYSSVKDRTRVDREIETLNKEGAIRVFKLCSGQDESALMLIEDYIELVDAAQRRMKMKHGGDDPVVFEWFRDHLIPNHTQLHISHSHLVSILSKGESLTEKQVTLLINAGLLVRQLVDPTQYWLSIPNIGSILKSLLQGRKEVVQLLKRRRYKEIGLRELEKIKLRGSILGMRFHIRDLLGASQICILHSTSGPFVKLNTTL